MQETAQKTQWDNLGTGEVPKQALVSYELIALKNYLKYRYQYRHLTYFGSY